MKIRFFAAGLAVTRQRWHCGRTTPAQWPLRSSSTEAVKQEGGGKERPNRQEDGAPIETLNSAAAQAETRKDDLTSLHLPLSPLVDRVLHAARNRYKTPKPGPTGEPSDFQRKLSKSPYAQALATPVRSCAITGVHLPNYFLIDFGLALHPKTGKPWQMPKLSIDHNLSPPSKAPSSEQPLDQTTTTLIQDATDAEAKPSDRRPSQTVAGSYILNQRSAIRLMSDVKRRSYMHMIPHRWKQDTRFKTDDIVWREDMDSFVLDLMRKKALRLLEYLSSKPAAYIARCEDYAEVQGKHQPGAVLWLGDPGGDANSNPDEEPPPPFAMVKYRLASHIPVFNLAALLGSEYLAKLRDSSRLFTGTMAVIKQKRNALTTLMHLWKLMGYVASEPQRDVWR